MSEEVKSQPRSAFETALLHVRYDNIVLSEVGESDVASFRSAFFSFPNEPADVKGPILAATELIKSNDRVKVTPWPQLSTFGAIIPDEVRAAIEHSDVLLCDITRPNTNVYYEIGYCIGVGKSLAPVLNVSFANAAEDIQKDGLFDIINYKSYENSVALAEIMSGLPSTVLVELYGKSLNNQQPIYFLNGYRKTDFVNAIAAAIKESKVHFRSFDPAETARFSIVTAIADITSSAGVIVPFLEPHIDDAPRHNIRAAFIAGLAHGLGREALLLRDQTAASVSMGADYRDDLVGIRPEPKIAEKVLEFSAQALIAAQSISKPKAQRRPQTRLQQLTLGATAAENEFRTLEDYFVETAEYLRTARGEARIVAGRKGSGKTAIFFMVREAFRAQKNTVVADLRPESHQLTLFKGELKNLLSAGAFDHTIAGFWNFLVLAEILLALKKEIIFQARRGGKAEEFAKAEEIGNALKRLGVSESGDFTTRINRLSRYVLEEIKSRQQKGEAFTPEEATNVVYRGGVGDAKRLVTKYASGFKHLLFLFDNIDKGWATDGVDELDVRLVRLLLEALERVQSDLAVDRLDFLYVVFLRNDVFELMVSGTPDKGKAAVTRIDWTDRIKLRQVIQSRMQSSIVDKVSNFNELWASFFTATVDGKDSFEFFVDHCLMRPRFLIAIIEYAIANAINRAHEKVEEDDCKDAVRQHSNSILNDFGYEIRDVSGASEKVLHALAGTTQYITKAEVLERFDKAKIIEKKDHDKLFQYMLWYGVLGVVNQNNVECYIYDFDYNMNRLEAEIDTQQDEPLYALNPAIYVALQARGSQSGLSPS